jgi:voltage-gated potassium channel
MSEHPFLRRLRTIALLVIGIVALGTLGFIFISGYPPFDALYMAVITIGAVGYFEVHPLTTAGRIFNMFLILFGASIMVYSMSAITQTVLETEFGELLGRRRTKKMIDSLKDHFLVCGFGRVGRAAAQELQRTHVPFLVMDRSRERVDRAMRAGMLAVLADSTSDDMLREAGVMRARGLIAALSTDADNLFLILSAKALNPNLKVASRVAEEGSEIKMRRAGADAVFMPYSMTGYRLAQSILRPHVFEFLDVTGTASAIGLNVGMDQVEIGHGSPMAGKSLQDLQLRRDLGVIVLAIRRHDGEMQFNPPASAIVAAGDTLIVMGGFDSVRKLAKVVAGEN